MIDNYKKIRVLLIVTLVVNIVGNVILNIRDSGALVYVNLMSVVYLLHFENKSNKNNQGVNLLLTILGFLLPNLYSGAIMSYFGISTICDNRFNNTYLSDILGILFFMSAVVIFRYGHKGK